MWQESCSRSKGFLEGDNYFVVNDLMKERPFSESDLWGVRSGPMRSGASSASIAPLPWNFRDMKCAQPMLSFLVNM